MSFEQENNFIEEPINHDIVEKDDDNEYFDRIVGTSEYQLAEQCWKEEANENEEKEIKNEPINTQNKNEPEVTEKKKENLENKSEPKETKKFSSQESEKHISNIFKEIEFNIKDQPESVQKIFQEDKDKFKTFATINGKDFIFTDIGGNDENRILALVRDENNSNKWKTRLFRISGSDNQWKSYPGKRENGDIMKGSEDDPLHHYVQSAKLDKEMYKIISTITTVENTTLKGSSAKKNYGLYIPQKSYKEPSIFLNEFEFKENQLELKNKEWDNYQKYSQKFFRQFMSLKDSSININPNKNNYDFIKRNSESLLKIKNGPQDFFKKMANAFDELYQQKEVKKLIENNQDYKIDLSNLNNLNTSDSFKKFAKKYQEGLGEFFEWGFSSCFVGGIPESLIPNFSKNKIVDSYQKGDINIEEYEVKSPEGDDLIFAMAHDKKGRVYIDNIYDPRVGMNDYGVPNQICQMGHLVYKPEDYDSQVFGIPEKYKKPGHGNYVDISALWENIPIIKNFKEELIKRGTLPLKR